MSGWGPSGDGSWVASGDARASNGGSSGWDDGTKADKCAGFGGYAAHPADSVNDDGGDRTCYNCGQPGHKKSDCPEPQNGPSGECRICKKDGHFAKDCPKAGPLRCGNCRKEGHHIDECPEPLVCPRCKGEHKVRDCTEPMKCRHCEGEHMARDCPTHVATCKNCGQEGHTASACENSRNIDRSHLPDMPGEEAWKLLESAIIERDIDDIKEKIQIYIKAQPETTFPELERALRSQGYGLYLIPLERANLAITLTNMDLQGNLGRKYTVNYRLSDKPRRQTEKEGWPENHNEILERLMDAGDVVPCGLPKCMRCGEIGHISKECSQEEIEADRVIVKCYNCDAEGHRIRDCPIPRVDKFSCKNCGKGGHKAADCEEPRSAANVECRKCQEMGHFSKDCPKAGLKGCRNCGQDGHMAKECTEPRNMANVQCHNCDEMGHDSKNCPKPRDMSRVKCMNCQQMGHFKSRCTNPPAEEDGAGVDANADGDEAIAAQGGAGGDPWGSVGW